MISKKFLQSSLIANNNRILRRIFTNKIINLSSGNFASQLNINFSHTQNALPLEALKIKSKKISNDNVNLNQMFLSKLNSYTDSVSFPVLKQKLTADLEKIDSYTSSQISSNLSFGAIKEVMQIIESLKTFRPFFINEFLDELVKDKKQTGSLSLEELETRGNELNDKLFLNEFPNQREVMGDILNFAEAFTKFLIKFNYYETNNHSVSTDENKIYNLKKFEFVRNIFESLNFELIYNAELVRILPCIVVLDRVYSFSALSANTFNCAVTRLIASQSLFLSELSDKEEKILLAQKNQKLLKDYVRHVFLTCGNLSNFSNTLAHGVFPSFEALLGNLVYLKDFIAESAELNELVFLLTQNILHFSYALGEIQKLNKSENKNINKAKAKNLFNLFKEFFNSYSFYLGAAVYKQGNSVKSLETNLLGKFANALILLKKTEKEYPETHLLKDDKDYQIILKQFVEEFLFKTVFAKQSILSNFIAKSDGAISLIELDCLFEVRNFDAKISLKNLIDYCSETVRVRDNDVFDLLRNAVDKYPATNINRVLMNILFPDSNANLFLSQDLSQVSESLVQLLKFQVKSAAKVFAALKTQINNNLKSLDLQTHFNLLYTQTKLNLDPVPLKSPLYISFLLKVSEKVFDSEKINPIKLAWVLSYHNYLDLNANVVLEQALKNLISYMRKETNWVTENNVEEILQVLVMIDALSLFDVKVSKTILEFFDKEIIANLIRNHIEFAGIDPRKTRVYGLLTKEPNVSLETMKLTNVLYVDAVVEYNDKKTPIMFVNDLDYNSEGDLITELLIKKKHFEDYFKTNVALVDSDKINSFSDLSKLLK